MNQMNRPSKVVTSQACPLDLVGEVDALLEIALRENGHADKTLAKNGHRSIVLVAMKKGARINEQRAPGGISIQMLAGHVELHVDKSCGDQWDMLPFLVRHTEGACSFFSMADETIDLSAGCHLALDLDMPHDVEALEDSAFIIDVVTNRSKALP